ncbi:MAG: ATP-dependent sacrificial sulfur transferase LarE [Bacillota bacterium]|nr:ATP-dependent sacrificial sulfur transferase LarE [Bacillota bacterium]
MINNEKYINLINYLKDLKSAAVAFSGGVDSTFVLKAAKEALGEKLIAITVVSPYIPKWEIAEAAELVKELGIKHKFIEVPIIDEIRFNPEDRCYLCKTGVFTLIKEEAAKSGMKYVVDGTNADDTKDYRPGLRALKELEVKSPLLDNNITKAEVREFSKELGLPTWDKPPYACLLSRLPYGTEITEEELRKIEEAEKYLMSIGFRAVRVRSHGNIARIEVDKKDRKRLFDEELLDSISKQIKAIGYKHVTLELEGYKMGSLN